MNKRQLALLFTISLIGWTVGNGLMPLLPVFGTRLGLSPAFVGYYMAFSFLALACGMFAAGWIFQRVGRARVLFVVGALVGAPLTWLIGRATTLWHVAALTGATWFLGG